MNADGRRWPARGPEILSTNIDNSATGGCLLPGVVPEILNKLESRMTQTAIASPVRACAERRRQEVGAVVGAAFAGRHFALWSNSIQIALACSSVALNGLSVPRDLR